MDDIPHLDDNHHAKLRPVMPVVSTGFSSVKENYALFFARIRSAKRLNR